ncbi:hypothetical protein F0U44_21115 [Nocardioides humilatus]|uniref:WD40 repeat domain-containing protein n=1 Tax=Nocardioides humilatus TaxID=2607660 RepID=A0A5B1L4Q0_9ACTN|nr:hypothetical protein [Nocardioides humilatus]KAA1415485.1 hypothetical protein F0U44_21115 [Nocardioides humilatus]
MNEHQLMETLHRVRDDILVGPPPVLQVTAAAARRQHRVRAGVIAATAAAVALAGTFVALRDDDPERPDPAIRPIENPAPVAWWGDGWLHVARAAVEMPRPDFLEPVGDGVVTWTQATPGGTESPLVHVADDGTSTTIGSRSGGFALASDVESGWVAWVDNPWGQDGTTELVVYDTRAGKEVGRRSLSEDGPRHEVLDEGPYPIAVEGSKVYYADWDADYRWDLAIDLPPTPVTDASTYLLGLTAGVTMTRTYDEHGYSSPTLELGGSLSVDLPYWAATLSPDGRYAAGGTSFGPAPRIYEIRPGRAIPTGQPDERSMLGYAFGSDGTITYTYGTPRRLTEEEVMNGPIPRSGSAAPYSIVTCVIATASCRTVVDDIDGDDGVKLQD